MRIGFFGGSFNPPTVAHIELAKKVKKDAYLDKVMFIPMGDWYQKSGLASAIDRFNMLKIACLNSDDLDLDVSDLEIKVRKKLDAIDAFKLITKNFPKDDRFFIMGADNFIKIRTWKESTELINNYNYIVIERAEINIKKYIMQNDEIYKNRSKIMIIDNIQYKNNSATDFREAYYEKSKEIEWMIPNEVLDYINEKGIFFHKF